LSAIPDLLQIGQILLKRWEKGLCDKYLLLTHLSVFAKIIVSSEGSIMGLKNQLTKKSPPAALTKTAD
jgi:hypothetical protein